MPDRDELANAYLDKTFPDTKGYQPSTQELAREKVDPKTYEMLNAVYTQLADQYGRRPTIEEVVRAATEKAYMERRRGL